MTNGLGLDYDLNQGTWYKQGDVRDVLRENLVRENKVPKFRPFFKYRSYRFIVFPNYHSPVDG